MIQNIWCWSPFFCWRKQTLLNRRCRKVPFSIEACTGTTYDVTKMQPQLFVCKSFEELTDALETFSKTMVLLKQVEKKV